MIPHRPRHRDYAADLLDYLCQQTRGGARWLEVTPAEAQQRANDDELVLAVSSTAVAVVTPGELDGADERDAFPSGVLLDMAHAAKGELPLRAIPCRLRILFGQSPRPRYFARLRLK